MGVYMSLFQWKSVAKIAMLLMGLVACGHVGNALASRPFREDMSSLASCMC